MTTIPEKDWEQMKSIRARVLDDACARILAGVESILQNREGRNHDAYLSLWALLDKEDSRISSMFDDFKRSTALGHLTQWRSSGLVSESDLALFTNETQNMVKAIKRGG